MIKAENLLKKFGPITAVNDVSFYVPAGEVLGFLGPNGAGKSTTMQMVTGFLPADGGNVTIGDYSMEENPIAAKSLLGYLPENAPMYPEMSVLGFLNFIAEIRGYKGEEKQKAVARGMETCFLEDVKYQTIDTLSRGFKRRVCLAQALLHDPPALILDEPTDGLDPNQKHEVRNLINTMRQHKAIILSTHILEEVDAVCTRTAVIDRGKIVFDGSPEEFRARSGRSGSVVVAISDDTIAESQITQRLVEAATVQNVESLTQKDSKLRFRVYPENQDSSALSGELAAEVASVLREQQIPFEELRTDPGDFEEVFRELTVSETAAPTNKDEGDK